MTQKKEAFYSVRKIALDLLIEIMEKEAFCEYHRTDGHNTGEPNEYFAEAYMASIYDPVGMQEACPQTYEFVMNISKSMKPLF